jgi:hypothetical protein
MIVALFRRERRLVPRKSGLFENQYHSQDGVGEETVTFFRYTLGLLLSVAFSFTLSVRSAVAQFPPSPQSAAFTGAWCAQGDPSKHASIADNGGFLTLTNETGDTSPGQYQGETGIVAPGWQFVTGTLSPDGSQINWSNGTFWARCNSGGGGGGGRHRLNLTGTWYAQGNRSQSCSIQQRGNNLQLSNESGGNASGQMNGKRTLTTNWNGTTIGGTVSDNGNRINWDNGTYWIRFRVYSSQNN